MSINDDVVEYLQMGISDQRCMYCKETQHWIAFPASQDKPCVTLCDAHKEELGSTFARVFPAWQDYAVRLMLEFSAHKTAATAFPPASPDAASSLEEQAALNLLLFCTGLAYHVYGSTISPQELEAALHDFVKRLRQKPVAVS